MKQGTKELDIRDNTDLKEALDRGIDDMEAGREHPLDEAMQIVDSIMKLRILPCDLSVCKVPSVTDMVLSLNFFFICHTDEEVSLVCRTEDVPKDTIDREDGWRAMRFEGVLDFSLVGILSKVCGILAEEKISIFVTSSYNTDYVLVKVKDLDRAVKALKEAGYEVE